MKSVPASEPRSIRLGYGDFMAPGKQLAFLHTVPPFLDAVSRVCPSCAMDIMNE